MDYIEKVVKNIDLKDLEEKDICYFCVASGIPIEDALHNPDEMEDDPISSNLKCPHCYNTEEESGRLRLTKKQRTYAENIIKEFKKYKRKCLKIEYYF